MDRQGYIQSDYRLLVLVSVGPSVDPSDRESNISHPPTVSVIHPKAFHVCRADSKKFN